MAQYIGDTIEDPQVVRKMIAEGRNLFYYKSDGQYVLRQIKSIIVHNPSWIQIN